MAKKIDMRVVPMTEWGKDHWMLFGYIEARCVDHLGVIDKRHVRCNPRRHPGHAQPEHAVPHGPYPYPSRLREGTAAVEGHDDWDCLDDMEAAGLIELKGTGLTPRVVLTPAGTAMAGELRAWKAKGGMFATFAPTRADTRAA